MSPCRIISSLAVIGISFLLNACGDVAQESQVSNAAGQTYVQDLTAVLRGPCPAGYSVFAWDGTTKINYCVLYGSGVPTHGVVALGGWMPTNWQSGSYTTKVVEQPCSHMRVGTYPNIIDPVRFAYDGDAGISYCMLKSSVAAKQSYVTQVSANMGRNCPDKWQQFVWNGRSNISFCYQTAARP